MKRREILIGAPGLLALGGCGTVVGSVLPDSELPGIVGLTGPQGWPVPGFARDEFRRGVAILNVWASWCPYCQGEHDHLVRLSRDGRFRLLGLLYQDRPAKAAAYLARAGNPYRALAVDDGRLSSRLGQRGVPASYVIDRSARILAKVPGGVDDGSIQATLMPAIRRALGGQDAAG